VTPATGVFGNAEPGASDDHVDVVGARDGVGPDRDRE